MADLDWEERRAVLLILAIGAAIGIAVWEIGHAVIQHIYVYWK